MKHIDKFLQLVQELKKTTGKNSSGIGHANSLISEGKVVKSKSWNPPSASEENAYIEKNGMAAFGKWHLGIDSGADPKTKEHWHYIFKIGRAHV